MIRTLALHPHKSAREVILIRRALFRFRTLLVSVAEELY